MLDFPANPAPGSIWENWLWDGVKWTGGGGEGLTVLPPSRNLTAAVNAGSVTIPTNTTWQQFTQTSAIATYSTIMPAVPVDGQDLIIATRGTISAWTLTAPSGQSIDAVPTTLPAGTSVWFRWIASLSTWVRLL